MSLTSNNDTIKTDVNGSIDYAYYDNRARIARSRSFSDSPAIFRGFVLGLVSRLALPLPTLTRGPLAQPCS